MGRGHVDVVEDVLAGVCMVVVALLLTVVILMTGGRALGLGELRWEC